MNKVVKCHEYSYLVLQPIEIFSVYFPAHKISDSSGRWKSIADDETLKISAFLFMISMKIWFHKSPLIKATVSVKIYVPRGIENLTMSHSSVTPTPFRSVFEVGHLISMWERPALKIYNNILGKKNIYIAFFTPWKMCFTLKNSEADKRVFFHV